MRSIWEYRMKIWEIKRGENIIKLTCRNSKATTFGRKDTGSFSDETWAVKSFIAYIEVSNISNRNFRHKSN